MGKYYYNADGKSREEIMDEFVRICKVGTSRDCMVLCQDLVQIKMRSSAC